MENKIKRFNKLLVTGKTALLVIDIQERFIRVINEFESVLSNSGLECNRNHRHNKLEYYE